MASRSARLALATMMVGVLLLVLLQQGCATAQSPASPDTQAAGKPYGSLVITSTGDDVTTIDPLIAQVVPMTGAGRAIFDTLLDYDAKDQLVPGIAERWEVAPDGMSWTFYIRKGVKFHNGDDLTGADVKFSLDRMLGPESVTASDAGSWRKAVASIELKDPYTIVMRMKEPQFDPQQGIDQNMAAVVPKKYIEEKGVDYFRKNPIGSGPWKFVRAETGVKLELEAVDNHWRKTPQFKNITLLLVPEEGTKAAMLKTGELDMALVAVDSLPGLKAAGLKITSYDGGHLYYISPYWDVENPKASPLSDVKVRKALQVSINQKELADKFFDGRGAPVARPPMVSPNAFFFDPSVLKADPFDPEGAKKLLAEAGYANGFDTRIVHTPGIFGTLSQALSAYWRNIGVRAPTASMEYATIKAMIVPLKTAPGIFNSVWLWNTGNMRNFERMTTFYHSKRGSNTSWSNPKLDALIDRYPTIKDPAEKKKIALEAAAEAKNDYFLMGFVADYNNLVTSAKIGDVELRATPRIFAVQYETITHPK